MEAEIAKNRLDELKLHEENRRKARNPTITVVAAQSVAVGCLRFDQNTRGVGKLGWWLHVFYWSLGVVLSCTMVGIR